MAKTVSITEEGRKDLENELEQLIARRPEIAEKIALARSYGDLSENGNSRNLATCQNYQGWQKAESRHG